MKRDPKKSKINVALRKLREAKRCYDDGVRRLGKSPPGAELQALKEERERSIGEVVSILLNSEEPSLPPRR